MQLPLQLAVPLLEVLPAKATRNQLGSGCFQRHQALCSSSQRSAARIDRRPRQPFAGLLRHPKRPQGFPRARPRLPPSYRFRHLMLDLVQLIPHAKKDSKLDTKSERNLINEVADMKVGGGRGYGMCLCLRWGVCGVWVGGVRSMQGGFGVALVAGWGSAQGKAESSIAQALQCAAGLNTPPQTCARPHPGPLAPSAAALPQGCTSVMFFEARKHKDLYLWLAKTPNGPSAKFHVTNSACILKGAALAG